MLPLIMQTTAPWRIYMMWVVMYLMFMPLGMWMLSLPNVLEAYDARWALPYATALPPFAAIFSALLFGALSDQKLNGEHLLGGLALCGAVFLALAYSVLKWGWHPGWFLFFLGCNALVGGPMFALITKIKLVNLPNPEKSFPLYSLGGTMGWMSGGLLVSSLDLDASATVGQVAGSLMVLGGLFCFLMPATPPTDLGSRGWKARLGLGAFSLLKDRELRVFYVASALFAIPCVSFFMFVPKMLMEFGSQSPAAQMTLGQVTEIGTMFFLSYMGGRYRARWFIMVGLIFGGARFLLFALAGQFDWIALIWMGISLHGPVFTFTSVAGRMFLDKRVPQTMRGQAQALFQLLVLSVAGIIGAFFCEWLYHAQVALDPSSWVLFWSVLTLFSAIPLIYFYLGVRGSSGSSSN